MRTHGAFSVYVFLNGMSSLCYSMIFTIELIYQAKVVGLNPLQLVLIGSVQQSVNFLCQAPTGILADMYSRRWAVVLGIMLVGVSYLVEGLIPVFAVVLMAAGLGGLGSTLANGADAAWIADELGVEHVGESYIHSAQVGTIGSLLGIAASAILVNFHLNLPIVLGGSLFIALSIILACVMPERHFIPMAREGRSTIQQMRHTLRASVQVMRLRPVLLTILSITVFYGMFSAGFDRFWPYYLLHQFTFPSLGNLSPVVWFCMIEAGIVITNWIGIEVVRRCINMQNHHAVAWTLLSIDGIQIICVIVFALAGQFVLALSAFWLFTTAVGPRVPLLQTWMNQYLDSSVRATVLSLKGQVDAIAHIIGGPFLGVIATLFSTRVALITAGILLSPALLLYACIVYHRK